MTSGTRHRTLKPLLLIPFAVLLVVHPLLIHGPSCGQDLAFHVQSWLDAAQQLRHGTLYPHWDVTAAWNAGEPRFLFYPPLSWMFGAILTLIFPTALSPTIFIAIALLAAGFSFHKLASEFASPNAALIASTLYLANPYMLFTAFERSALAELLAAAWIPLLLLALLRPIPTDLPSTFRTIRAMAIPLALLWLTNAPAAVIGSYAVALVATLRVLHSFVTSLRPNLIDPRRSSVQLQRNASQKSSSRPERSEVERPPYFSSPTLSTHAPATIQYPWAPPSSRIAPHKAKGSIPWIKPFHLALTYVAGTLLGLSIAALYLLPAAFERKYIQTTMALLPNMRYQDNFLFTHTTDAAHNAVNHTISLLALAVVLLTATTVLTLFLTKSLTRHNPLAYPLSILTLTIALLLTPISTPIWHHLPNLAYLQFPWRLLTLLTPILALSIALLLDTGKTSGAPHPASEAWFRRIPNPVTTTLTLLIPLALAIPAYRLYHQPPDPTDDPTHLAQLFSTHHGFSPTDEYTPTQADNDPLRSNDPAYWLAVHPNDPAPNTTPTAVELNPSLDTDDNPIPDAQTLSNPAPHHFQIHAPTRSYLILNLRDYPSWDITEADSTATKPDHPSHFLRTDGLIAIALNHADDYTIDITWRRTLDQTLGLILSTLALLALALTYRKPNPPPPPNPVISTEARSA